jgi:CDP-glycerol glycerophosphotransferase
MVTDYSSTMFDFAVTGKPLLFYTYDMDHYRDKLRGFYFDLAGDPPGPLSTTTDELVKDIRRLPLLPGEYRDAYARFRERFCPHDDGHATERFVDRFFGRSD